MVKQLWMSGVIMAFLSFGIKAGMGIGSRVFNPGVSRKSGLAFFLGTLLTYVVLFAVLFLVVTQLDLLAFLDRIVRMMQFGMYIHMAVAVGLFVWGLKLLLAPNGSHQHASAGLFLMLPCPVCATVILLNLTMALSLSKMAPWATTLALFGIFWGIILVTLGGLALFRRQTGMDNGFLGAAMVLISVYFLATVLIAPIYPKIKPAFAMAVSNNPVQGTDTRAMLILAACCIVLAGFGFIKKLYAQKGERS